MFVFHMVCTCRFLFWKYYEKFNEEKCTYIVLKYVIFLKISFYIVLLNIFSKGIDKKIYTFFYREFIFYMRFWGKYLFQFMHALNTYENIFQFQNSLLEIFWAYFLLEYFKDSFKVWEYISTRLRLATLA